MKFNSISVTSMMIGLSCAPNCHSLMMFDPIPMNDGSLQTHITTVRSFYSSTRYSSIDGAILLISLNDNDDDTNASTLKKEGFQRDKVVRIIDGNTIKLEKAGLASIAGARYPTASSSNFQFSECWTYGPTYKLRQLIPAKTDVWVKIRGSKPQAVIFRQEDSMNVNQELVKSGFAKAKRLSSEFEAYLDPAQLKSWETEANRSGLGIFKQCDATSESSFVAEFEPLEYDVETQWGDDGGKQIVKRKEDTALVPPKNPGDVKGCSDFETYEDALRWYEKYKPFYGDVAKLIWGTSKEVTLAAKHLPDWGPMKSTNGKSSLDFWGIYCHNDRST